jgi:hypothetical protein
LPAKAKQRALAPREKALPHFLRRGPSLPLKTPSSESNAELESQKSPSLAVAAAAEEARL